MKRIIAVLMVTLLIFSLAACGGKNDDTTNPTTTAPTTENTVTETTPIAGNNDTTDSVSDGNTADVADNKALNILNTVWATYSVDDANYFSAAGGDMLTEATTNWEGPAAFGTTGDAAEAFESMLHFPNASVSKLTAAASLMHAMNANTFTCGAFQVADTTEIEALTTEIKTTIDGTQWMCGFPEKVLIVTVDDVILACVGNTQLVDDFSAKLSTAYTNTTVVINEAIVA